MEKQMKKYILLVVSVLFVLTSCDDFLEPKSQDKIIPKTVVDLKEFLLGEVILTDKDDFGDATKILDFLSDDVTSDFHGTKAEDKQAQYWGYYAWQAEPEVQKNNVEREDKSWELFYHKIFMCNIILDRISESEGEQVQKDRLRAEAHFMRAHCYFMLVNMYGTPYDKDTNSDFGVPINEEVTIVNQLSQRETVHTVYRKIEDELTLAIEFFKKSETLYNNPARPNLTVAYLLMSRMYLFQKEYEKTRDYASLVIDISGDRLFNINPKTDGKIDDKNKYLISLSNSGILFVYGYKHTFNYIPYKNNSFYILPKEFLNLYKDADSRKAKYFKLDYNSSTRRDVTTVNKSATAKSFGKAYRIYEAYLNRAEANAHLKETSAAINDMKLLYPYRHSDEVNITATTQQEVIDLIKLDRRLEFCFEDFRWFDLRRYGMPEMTRTYITADGDLEYTISAKSNLYTLPIPKQVRLLEPNIKRIDR
jgi:hypothetical protein